MTSTIRQFGKEISTSALSINTPLDKDSRNGHKELLRQFISKNESSPTYELAILTLVSLVEVFTKILLQEGSEFTIPPQLESPSLFEKPKNSICHRDESLPIGISKQPKHTFSEVHSVIERILVQKYPAYRKVRIIYPLIIGCMPQTLKRRIMRKIKIKPLKDAMRAFQRERI